jgi:hypothetical protein
MNKNMEKRLFHSVPTEMAVDRGMLPHLLRLVKVGSVSMLAFRKNFRTPQGRLHMYDFQVMPSLLACNRAKRFPCMA